MPTWICCLYIEGVFFGSAFALTSQTFDKTIQGWQGLHSAETPEKANYLDCIAEMQSLQVMQDYIINPSIFLPHLLSSHYHFNCSINIYITTISK